MHETVIMDVHTPHSRWIC